MRVASEVFDNVFRATKWPPRIDDPVQASDLPYEAVEFGGSMKGSERAREVQFKKAGFKHSQSPVADAVEIIRKHSQTLLKDLAAW